MNKQVTDTPPLLRLQTSITARDDRLLGWLYDHGTLTTDQIAKALFSSLDFAQRRLLRLTNLKAVTRFRPNRLDGGSYPYHYVLAQLGYEHVMGQRGLGLPRRDQARRRYQSLISRPDLPHLLGGNGVFIDLAAHERTHPGTKLASWQPPSAFHSAGAYFRFGSHPKMAGASIHLPRPDGAGVWAEQGRAVPFFVEYDTGSERLEILAEKIGKYELLVHYADSWWWPVLFVLPSVVREQHLHDRLVRDPRIVVATTAGNYLDRTGKTPAEDVWRIIGLNQPRAPLIELPYLDPVHDEAYRSSTETVVPQR